jgi:hypothetical protein
MAARLLGESGIKSAHGWTDTPTARRPRSSGASCPPINGRTVLGFLDLIEARFIRYFDHLGLSPQSIRKVAEKLRARHDADHPFATNKRFRTDVRKIFGEIVGTEQELKILNLMNDNFEMHEVIEASLFDRILYADDLAYRWREAGRPVAAPDELD